MENLTYSGMLCNYWHDGVYRYTLKEELASGIAVWRNTIFVIHNNRHIESQCEVVYGTDAPSYHGFRDIHGHLILYTEEDARDRFTLLDASAHMLYEQPILTCHVRCGLWNETRIL